MSEFCPGTLCTAPDTALLAQRKFIYIHFCWNHGYPLFDSVCRICLWIWHAKCIPMHIALGLVGLICATLGIVAVVILFIFHIIFFPKLYNYLSNLMIKHEILTSLYDNLAVGELLFASGVTLVMFCFIFFYYICSTEYVVELNKYFGSKHPSSIYYIHLIPKGITTDVK